MWGCPGFISTRDCQGNSLIGSERRPSCSCKQLELSLCFLLLQMFPWVTLQPPLRVTEWGQRDTLGHRGVAPHHEVTSKSAQEGGVLSDIENVPLGGSEVGVCSFLSSGQAAAGSITSRVTNKPQRRAADEPKSGSDHLLHQIWGYQSCLFSSPSLALCSVGWMGPLQFPNHHFWCFSLHKTFRPCTQNELRTASFPLGHGVGALLALSS